jgi:DNA-binding response OmpR family regulator
MGDKILIIDDDPQLTEVMKRALQLEGYKIFTARNGKEGMRAFYENRPDLVILDVMMPYLNGFEVCERIREMADTPILMLTAKDSEDDILKAINLGATDYLSKLFDLDVLIRHAGILLQRGRDKKS